MGSKEGELPPAELRKLRGSIAAVTPQKAKSVMIRVGGEDEWQGVIRKPTGRKVGLVATVLCQDDSC